MHDWATGSHIDLDQKNAVLYWDNRWITFNELDEREKRLVRAAWELDRRERESRFLPRLYKALCGL